MSNQNGQQNPGSPTKVLVFGIIGLALCESGILGLIFSIIGLVQAKKYVAQYDRRLICSDLSRRFVNGPAGSLQQHPSLSQKAIPGISGFRGSFLLRDIAVQLFLSSLVFCKKLCYTNKVYF